MNQTEYTGLPKEYDYDKRQMRLFEEPPISEEEKQIMKFLEDEIWKDYNEFKK